MGRHHTQELRVTTRPGQTMLFGPLDPAQWSNFSIGGGQFLVSILSAPAGYSVLLSRSPTGIDRWQSFDLVGGLGVWGPYSEAGDPWLTVQVATNAGVPVSGYAVAQPIL